MSTRSTFTVSLIKNAHVPGIADVRAKFDGIAYTTEQHEHSATVKLGGPLDDQMDAFMWLKRHADIQVQDEVSLDNGDGTTTEYMIVGLKNYHVAVARGHSEYLTGLANERNRKVADASKPLDRKQVAENARYVVERQSERDLWDEVIKDGNVGRAFSLALRLMCDARTDQSWQHEHERFADKAYAEGLRRFMVAARVYLTDEEAVDALLSI